MGKGMIEDISVDKPWLMMGDCLERMEEIPDGSVDMICADLPYGTTQCGWDSIIPLDSLWGHYRRITKRNAAIVLTANQPFTSVLVMNNLDIFRYSLVWDKVNRFTGHLNAKKMPMRSHEDILVFYKRQPTFHPEKRIGVPYVSKRGSSNGTPEVYGSYTLMATASNGGSANPGSIIREKGQVGRNVRVHPTAKPIGLMERIVRIYTNENDLVLDNCFGGGSSGVACVNTRRRFIGIESDEKYFNVGVDRISEAISAREMELV